MSNVHMHLHVANVANQDKFWVTDPDGVEWVVYHLNHDVEDEDEVLAETVQASNCCTPKLSRIGKTA
jgi:hypothetical protein